MRWCELEGQELANILNVQPALFPRIDLASCLPVSSLQRLNRAPAVQTLAQLFSSAYLNPRIGLNQGTGSISISIGLWPELEEERVLDQKQAIVWLMLGLFPNQGQIENLRDAQTNLVANQCLSIFEDQTGIAIVERKIDFRLKYMQLRIDSIAKKIYSKEGTAYTDSMASPFRYCPVYTRLTGYDEEAKEYSEATLDLQQEELIQEMATTFWQAVENRRYFPDLKLRTEVNDFLQLYIKAGLCGQRESFSPNKKSLALYLHGTAGIGKSSFVTTFVSAFQEIIIKYIEPTKRWGLVKVPLNSISPLDLAKILKVKGISDWSIERVVEQTIARGGVAVLHLEENPGDPTVQAELFDLIKKLISAITNRYTEYSSNLLYIVTSNDPPLAPNILAECKAISMSAPLPQVQRRWCVVTLEASLSEVIPGATITVNLEQAPELTQDMRVLDKWCTSLTFFLLRHLTSHGFLQQSDKQLAFTIAGPNPKQLQITFSHSSKAPPVLELVSEDGYTFFNREIQELRSTDHNSTLPHRIADRVLATLSMLQSRFLKPAVIVAHGEKKETLKEEIIRFAEFVFGAEKIHHKVIYANSEADKEAIFGSPNASGMRGLFQFLDSITNTIYERHDHYGLVVVYANVLGQFILREILENNDSKTHRTAVKKDRILFLVVVEDSISPQLHSRAHEILKLED